MTEPTIFHKILAKEIPSTVAHEDDEVLVIHDIHPKAKTHLLFIPKMFTESVATSTGDAAHIPGMLIEKARAFAEKQGMRGYKLQFNVGKEGGQEVG
jgi:histidine triad (HIT) family protein